MKHFKTLLFMVLLPLLAGAQTVTLDECQQLARENYPLIKRYDLISQMTDATVSNIATGWLPQVSAVAQATLQSDVMTLPDPLQNMLAGQGYDVKGLKKDQYRIGIDVNQNIWDGGLMSGQKEVARLQGDVQAAQADVDLYAIRQRVNELYFGILLLDEKIQLNKELTTLLESNLTKLSAMYKHGTAMLCDVNTLKAEKLKAEQTGTELETSKRSLCRMLAAFIYKDNIDDVVKPAEDAAGNVNNRPELKLFDAQIKLADAQEKLLDSRLMPRVSAFAQGYYGYPGYDMFHDMFHHSLSLNGMIGARVTWNIGGLYTRKSDKAKLQAQRDLTETARETFLFNNNLQQIQQNEAVQKYREMLADDATIVDLRGQVRKSAESKLTHGIIDTNNLLQEITRENQAKIDMQTHEIQMLKEIYDLKFTVNN